MHFSLVMAKAAVFSKAVVLLLLLYSLLFHVFGAPIVCSALFCYSVLYVLLVLQST